MFHNQTELQHATPATGPDHAPRRPLPAISICWMSGLGAGALFARYDIGWWLGIASLLCAIAGVLLSRRGWSCILIYLALFAAGMMVMTKAIGKSDPHRIHSLLRSSGQFAEVTGIIDAQPSIEFSDRADRVAASFQMSVRSIKSGSGFNMARGSLLVFASGLNEPLAISLKPGTLIRIRGAYRADDRSLLENRGRDGVMRVGTSQLEVLDAKAGNALVMLCQRARDRAARVLGWGLPEGDASVTMTRALLLGLRSDIDPRINDAFARTGTLHILSLSGTHIGILVMIMVILLKSAGIPRPQWVLFFLPVLTLYTIGTGGMASTVRASVMAIVYFLAYFLRRRPDAPSSLAFSALLILAYDPRQLFDLGFILSFVIVAGLIGLYRPVMSLMPPGSREAFIPGDEPSFFQQHLRPAIRRIMESFSVSVAAWLVSLPLIANLFHLISPVALLINLILIPLTFVMLLTACLSLSAGLVSYHLASLFNHANWLFNEGLIGLIDCSAGWPGSYFYVRAWPWTMVALWYGFLLFFMIGKRAVRWAALAAMLMLTIWSITERVRSDQVEVSVISSGSSAAMLVDGPGSHAMLIDAGSHHRSRRLIDYIRSRGIEKLDEIWLSRATADAYGGLPDLLASVQAERVRVPDVGTRQPAFSRKMRFLSGEGYTIEPWPEERHFERGDLVLKILHPEAGRRYDDAGSSALMMQISHHTRAMIFAGEGDARTGRALADKMADYGGSTLVMGRLSGPDGLTDLWLDRIRCRKLLLPAEVLDDVPVGAGLFIERLRARDGLEVIHIDDREPHRSLL